MHRNEALRPKKLRRLAEAPFLSGMSISRLMSGLNPAAAWDADQKKGEVRKFQ